MKNPLKAKPNNNKKIKMLSFLKKAFFKLSVTKLTPCSTGGIKIAFSEE